MKILTKFLFTCLLFSHGLFAQKGIVVFQSDFGMKDGAVSAMKGVATGVSPRLKLFDLTHEIPPYSVWEASYRLLQAAPYWPAGTVFVSVCDPGVGTRRKSVVLLTRSGHFFVTPDNGTLTHVAEALGIHEVREIDEVLNRRQNTRESYTFHGRDVYAYTGARLAARKISLKQVGPLLPAEVVSIPYQRATLDQGRLSGNIPILDIQYGNVWTNVDKTLFEQLGILPGEPVAVEIHQHDKLHFRGQVPYVHTFGEVSEGEAMAYFNSLMHFSLAINQGSFAEKYGIGSGAGWQITLRKP